jgi:hypothetical protein
MHFDTDGHTQKSSAISLSSFKGRGRREARPIPESASEKLLSAHRACRHGDLPRPAHRGRVIFERCTATEADLIILAMNAAVRPRKPMWAEPSKNVLEECGHNSPRAKVRRISWPGKPLAFVALSGFLSRKYHRSTVPTLHASPSATKTNGQCSRLAIGPIVRVAIMPKCVEGLGLGIVRPIAPEA